ncbi:MAG: glycosyhydrolase, partial [Bacteroidaceae bacterium]|nr:glycosyhydrolase [Bacteroidaceae bacterium]
MITNTLKRLTSLCILIAVSVGVFAADRFVSFDKGDLLIAQSGGEVKIYVDPADNIAVRRAAVNLSADIAKVCRAKASITSAPSEAQIVVGSIGHSKAVDKLVKAKNIDAKLLKNKVEKYISTVINNQLIIAGSDRRGAVYGIYELSSQMGVSPW